MITVTVAEGVCLLASHSQGTYVSNSYGIVVLLVEYIYTYPTYKWKQNPPSPQPVDPAIVLGPSSSGLSFNMGYAR